MFLFKLGSTPAVRGMARRCLGVAADALGGIGSRVVPRNDRTTTAVAIVSVQDTKQTRSDTHPVVEASHLANKGQFADAVAVLDEHEALVGRSSSVAITRGSICAMQGDTGASNAHFDAAEQLMVLEGRQEELQEFQAMRKETSTDV